MVPPPDASAGNAELASDSATFLLEGDRERTVGCPSREEVRPGPTTEIHVLDSEDSPVPGAAVFGWTGVRRTSIGETNEVGVISASITAFEGLVVIEKPFCVERVDTHGASPKELYLRLKEGRTIRGRVMIAGTHTPAAGVNVVALASSIRSSTDSILMAAQGEPTVPACVSEEDGAFEIAGLDYKTSYTLEAGGSGYVMPYGYTLQPGDNRAPQLEVKRLYGIHVFTVDDSGRVPDVSPRLGVDSCAFMSMDRCGDVESVSSFGPAALLCTHGTANPWVSTEYSLFEDVCLFAAASDAEAVGPIVLRKCVPGFEPAGFELWALPVTDHIAQRQVHLEPREGGKLNVGHLSVRLDGTNGLTSSATLTSPIPEIYIRYVDSGEQLFAAVDTSVDLDRIGSAPVGAVRAEIVRERLKSPAWQEGCVEQFLHDGLNVIAIDASMWGAVELVVRSRDGKNSLSGPARFDVMSEDGGRRIRSLRFSGAPYRYYGLDAGSYRVVAKSHGDASWDGLAEREITVEPAQLASVSWKMGR